MSTVLLVLLLGSFPSSPPEPIAVDDVYLTLIADVEVPAPESGELLEVVAKAGQTVKCGELLARVDDSKAQSSEARAAIELARLRHEGENDLKVQLARKRHEAAVAELKRAMETEKRLPNSVSQTEFDRLRLDEETAQLEIDQANFDMQTARFAVRRGEEELQLARLNVTRRLVRSPLDGVVVELMQQTGEWVEAGQPVVRIVQLDQLRAEGLLRADLANEKIMGSTVNVEVQFAEDRVESFAGTIVFVSPEIHPVNGKVQVWAEVENRDGLLRPGLSARMTIDPLTQP